MPSSKSVETALSLIKNKSSILELSIGPHSNITPGQEVPKADAQTPPEIALGSSGSADTYLAIGVDLDAPYPSFNILGPILHWIQPGLKPAGATLTSSGTPVIASWLPPTPPPGSGAHRFVFLLYEQPAGFDAKKYAPAKGAPMGMMPRMRYDLAAFEKQAGLGPVVAANYFRAK